MTLARIIPFLGAALATVAILSTVAFVPVRAADETELEQVMEEVNRTYRVLRRGIREPGENREELLTATRKIQDLVLKGSRLRPAMTAELPEGEQAAFVLGYKKEMRTFMLHALDLEIALMGGEDEAAGELVKAMNSLKSDSHKIYKKKDDDG